ncbi:c9995225-d21e-49de-9587-fd45d7d956d4 [Thermothielavioides terrestris]|uniref:C9995225-d21e-49de-9587-fd45d7d956d4 n=1 Tax=Thermothielavioides terrestris TaxID=2587410 RepID=A0A446BEB2_9PEZI|nr:c9995225-d21e-49de-9587-fd45d7d956d4 [Thermothielavioides terrestris]
MSRLKNLRIALPPFSPSNITSAPEASWAPVGLGKDVLLRELETLYWEGVRGELENIIRTLNTWQKPDFSHVKVDDEDDDFIHRFNTFIDQVTEESRAFAIRYGKLKEKEMELRQKKTKNATPTPNYAEALEELLRDRKTDYASFKLRADVRRAIDGFLDMEKLIEHRPPLDKLGFWKRPAIPQLALSEFDELWIPRLEPLRCSRPECGSVIRGSMFVSTGASPRPDQQKVQVVICEDCYRSVHYGDTSFTKSYKHCILAEAITPRISRALCRCKTVRHYDGSGNALALFPVPKGAYHLDVGGTGTVQCSLLKLGEIVALAKYNGLQSVVGSNGKRLEPFKLPSSIASNASSSPDKDRASPGEEGSAPNKASKQWTFKRLETKTESSLSDSATRVAASGSTTAVTEATADEDIPLFFRRFTSKYPFGNVHMALRVGPLVIENGVAHTKRGALITLREPPVFQDRLLLFTPRTRSLAVGGTAAREIWQQDRPPMAQKRYKAVMKQVVGTPFTGILPHGKELDIVNDLLAASRKPFDDPGLPVAEQQKLISEGLDQVLGKLKTLIHSRVMIYLESIADRLLDPNVKLTWSATANNCQSFCNALIDPKLFGPLVSTSTPKTDASPLYVMSFVCPDEGYLQRGVATKYDVPSGLTEEYLLRFHFGRHDEADMIDTQQEYWYDWGAFGGPLYKYQDLFPWDCTEAYGRYPTRCGACNLAKHVWAFPFDAWSVTALHLTRDRHLYGPARVDPSLAAAGPGATPQTWMRNRLTVLAANSILSRAAVAMTRTPRFARATAWLFNPTEGGLLATYPALAHVKLGGIHRAQPFSHYFEAGTYSHFFLAEWALRPRPEQVAAYEELRDGRVRLPDVVRPAGGRFRTSSISQRDRAHGFAGFHGAELASRAMLDAMDAAAADATSMDANGGWLLANALFTASDLGAMDLPGAEGPACAVGSAQPVEEEAEEAVVEVEEEDLGVSEVLGDERQPQQLVAAANEP